MIGTQVGGYRIDEKLGEGGMGTVYRATEVNLDRTVAIKVLNPDLAQKPVILERFRTEAKAQANLNHQNVAILYAFLTEHGNAMMVMEFVDGENFQQIVNRRGPVPADEVVPLFKQALLGVGAAHEMGIVHRDLKPANIMLNRRGIVKVMDFGIAKVVGERGLTRTGVQLGTVFYMSPEQVKGQVADTRADIYALGVTLYEMLTAHVPFDGASEYDVLTGHVHTAPPLPSTHGGNIPKGIEQIVLKALEKKPEDRFQTVAEFAEALDHPEAWESFVPKSAAIDLAGTAPTAEIPVGPWRGQSTTLPVSSATQTTLPPPLPNSFWTPVRSGIAAFAVVALICAGAFAVLRKPAADAKPVASSPAPVKKEEPAAPPPLTPLSPEARGESPTPEPALKEPMHFVIPAKTAVHVHLTAAIDGAAVTEGEEFPVAFVEGITISGLPINPPASNPRIVLTKSSGAKKSQKLQFQLSSLKIAGNTYKVKSDTFEFNGSTQGKRAGKFGAIGNAVGSMVGGKHKDGTLELPPDTEMNFTLKAPIPVAVR